MRADWGGSVCRLPWAHGSPSAHTVHSHTQDAVVAISRGSALGRVGRGHGCTGPALLPQGQPLGSTVPLWSGPRVGLGPEGASVFSTQQKYTVSHKGIF